MLEENLELFLINYLRLEFGATIDAAPGGGMMGFGVTLGPGKTRGKLKLKRK